MPSWTLGASTVPDEGSTTAGKPRSTTLKTVHGAQQRLNHDVLWHLVTTVERRQDLLALMRVSRELYELALRQLCRTAGAQAIRTARGLSSFVRFANSEGPMGLSTPRKELIKKLYLAPANLSISGYLSHSPIGVHMRDALLNCNGIWTLRVDGEYNGDGSTLSTLCDTIPHLQALRDLRLSPHLSSKLTHVQLQGLLRRHGLQVLHLPPQVDDFYNAMRPPVLLELAQTIEDLELPIRNWLLPSTTRFATVRRLKWLPPKGSRSVLDWGRIFPSLSHLGLYPASPHRNRQPGDHPTILNPVSWPSLESLWADDYESLAQIVPHTMSHVPRLSLSIRPGSHGEEVEVPKLLDILSPTCLELRLRDPNEITLIEGNLVAHGQLRRAIPLVCTSKTRPELRSVVLSFFGRGNVSDGFKYALGVKPIVDSVLHTLRAVSPNVTHLLVRHEMARGAGAKARGGDAPPLLEHVSAVVRRSALYDLVYTAMWVVRSLRWVGIIVNGRLTAWEIGKAVTGRRETSSTPKVREMDPGRGWDIVYAEGMGDFVDSRMFTFSDGPR